MCYNNTRNVDFEVCDLKRISIAIVFIALIAYLPLLAPAQVITAQEESLVLDPIDIRIELLDNEISIMYLRARLVNQGSTNISEVDIRLESLDVVLQSTSAGGQEVDGSVVRFDRYSEVNVPLTTELAANESTWITIQAQLNDVQVNNGVSLDGLSDLWDFIFYVRPTMTYGNFSLTAVLPNEATLSEDSVVPLYPESSLNFTDGQAMGFIWNISLIHSGQSKVFIAKYQVLTIDGFSLEAFYSLIIIIGFVGLVAGLLIAGFGPSLIKRVRQIGTVKVVGITSEEEEVLEAIRQKGGSCSQKELYTSMDLSQSKISLILTNLEERNLVRRMREGRENTIHLCED